VFDTFFLHIRMDIAILATNKKNPQNKNKNLPTGFFWNSLSLEREGSGRESVVLDEPSRRRLYSTVVDSWFRTAKAKEIQSELSSLHSLACHRPVERRARIVCLSRRREKNSYRLFLFCCILVLLVDNFFFFFFTCRGS
jgi:hypothetical protein